MKLTDHLRFAGQHYALGDDGRLYRVSKHSITLVDPRTAQHKRVLHEGLPFEPKPSRHPMLVIHSDEEALAASKELKAINPRAVKRGDPQWVRAKTLHGALVAWFQERQRRRIKDHETQAFDTSIREEDLAYPREEAHPAEPDLPPSSPASPREGRLAAERRATLADPAQPVVSDDQTDH